MFQLIKQPSQTKCTKHWALVPVTSHSEHVTHAAAVTRYLHLSHYYIVLTREQCILGNFMSLCINPQLLISHPFALNRTVPLKIWSCLCPTVSQGPLVGRSLLLQIIIALCSPLKTPQIGFRFYVSVLHLKTTLILGFFTRETQCEKLLCLCFYWLIHQFLCHVFLINVFPF